MSGRAAGVAGVVLGLYVLGWIALTGGANGLFENLIRSTSPVSPEAGIRGGEEDKGELGIGLYGIEPYLEVAGAILLGVSSAFWVFWKLQCGVQGRGRNLCLVVLIFSFVMCAYGFGLLLELAAQGG